MFCSKLWTSIPSAVNTKGHHYEIDRDRDSRNGSDGFGGCSGPADGPGYRGSPSAGPVSTGGHVYIAWFAGSYRSACRFGCNGPGLGDSGRGIGGSWSEWHGWSCKALSDSFTGLAVNQAAPCGLLFFVLRPANGLAATGFHGRGWTKAYPVFAVRRAQGVNDLAPFPWLPRESVESGIPATHFQVGFRPGGRGRDSMIAGVICTPNCRE